MQRAFQLVDQKKLSIVQFEVFIHSIVLYFWNLSKYDAKPLYHYEALKLLLLNNDLTFLANIDPLAPVKPRIVDIGINFRRLARQADNLNPVEGFIINNEWTAMNELTKRLWVL